MNVLAWVLSGLLAVAFVGSGAMKLVTPYEKLAENPRMAWANDFSPGQIRMIGTLEVLGGIGVVLPWAVDVLPVLTPLAAVGLALIMVGALRTHGRRGELGQAAPVNGVLLTMSVVVAVIRFSQL